MRYTVFENAVLQRVAQQERQQLTSLTWLRRKLII